MALYIFYKVFIIIVFPFKRAQELQRAQPVNFLMTGIDELLFGFEIVAQRLPDVLVGEDAVQEVVYGRGAVVFEEFREKGKSCF